MPEPTIAQRIVRAKRTLAEARVPFEVPRGAELAARLASVLEVIYLIFNEGYAATAGDDWMRPALCEEALRLGRILAGLAPDEPEVHGLVALMEIQASRARARVGADGEPVLLLDQDRSRWDRLLIRRGLAALARAEDWRSGDGARPVRAAGGDRGVPRARARPPKTPTGRASPRCTTRSRSVTASPVVELNRAVALAMAFGPARGLEVADALTRRSRSLQGYHLLPSVRGDLLLKLGTPRRSAREFERAATHDAQRARAFAARAAGAGMRAARRAAALTAPIDEALRPPGRGGVREFRLFNETKEAQTRDRAFAPADADFMAAAARWRGCRGRIRLPMVRPS